MQKRKKKVCWDLNTPFFFICWFFFFSINTWIDGEKNWRHSTDLFTYLLVNMKSTLHYSIVIIGLYPPPPPPPGLVWRRHFNVFIPARVYIFFPFACFLLLHPSNWLSNFAGLGMRIQRNCCENISNRLYIPTEQRHPTFVVARKNTHIYLMIPCHSRHAMRNTEGNEQGILL